MPFSHSFWIDLSYNETMRCSKRGFYFFLVFSFFYTVTNAASSAAPGQSGFPPFPPDQELHGEGSSEQPTEKSNDQNKLPPEVPVDNNSENNPETLPPPLPPKDSEHIFYYRGSRAYAEELPLTIYQINCERIDENLISLELVFNQSINPRSVHRDSLLIDRNNLPEGIRFSFNKKGDRLKAIIPVSANSFGLTVQNVRAFDGTMIEPVEIIAYIEDFEEFDESDIIDESKENLDTENE